MPIVTEKGGEIILEPRPLDSVESHFESRILAAHQNNLV